MFVVANLLSAIAQLLSMLIYMYLWIVLGRVIISWVGADPYNQIVRFLVMVTEPVLFRIRRTVPTAFGGIDFAPFLLVLGLLFLDAFLVQTLRDLAVAIH